MERERRRDGKGGTKGGVMTGKNEHEYVWRRKDQLRKRRGVSEGSIGLQGP